MRARPLTPDALVAELAERVAALPPAGPATRVLIDGAPPSDPAGWAQALVGPLQVRGRPVLRASAEDFLRPASLRLERGRTDPNAYYSTGWTSQHCDGNCLSRWGRADRGGYCRAGGTRSWTAPHEPST